MPVQIGMMPGALVIVSVGVVGDLTSSSNGGWSHSTRAWDPGQQSHDLLLRSPVYGSS